MQARIAELMQQANSVTQQDLPESPHQAATLSLKPLPVLRHLWITLLRFDRKLLNFLRK